MCSGLSIEEAKRALNIWGGGGFSSKPPRKPFLARHSLLELCASPHEALCWVGGGG